MNLLLFLAANTWLLGPFVRPPQPQPVLAPNKAAVFTDPISGAPVHWEALHTFNPSAIVRNGKVFLLYRAEDDSGQMAIGGHTSRIGLAQSEDGLHFTREAEPVLFPSNDAEKDREWPGGCEDPRLVESEDGTYVITYTQWNRTTYDAAIATSTDLRHWTKHGPAFAASYHGKYKNLKYKSAAIVTNLRNGRLIAAKIAGKYWMYWGEGQVHLAVSTDLVHWDPVEDAKGELVAVLGPRPQLFDSSFPEVGPPPVLTDQGIIVIYNGKNAKQQGAPSLAADTYAAGQALFQPNSPALLIDRLPQPFLKPEQSWERSGQYAAGTTFAEGLVYFKDRWFLYYGCADSLVGVAIK